MSESPREWGVTTDLATAMYYGYIGEIDIVPKPVASAVNLAMGGERLLSGIVFFCGKRDADLSAYFGYTTVS